MKAELLELAEKVEALAAPDREVDAGIFAACRPEEVPSPIVESGYGWRFDGQGWWCETGEDARTPRQSIYPPRYTASLEAAVDLVPRMAAWRVTSWPKTGQAAAKCEYGPEVGAATPALALCSAALRSLSGDSG